MLSLVGDAKADAGEGYLKEQLNRDRRKRWWLVMMVTKTWEDGMAGKHSRCLVCLEGGGNDCSLGMCLAVGRV